MDDVAITHVLRQPDQLKATLFRRMLIRRPKVGEGDIEDFLADPNTQNLGSCLGDLSVLIAAVLSRKEGEFGVDFPFDKFEPNCPDQAHLRSFDKSGASEAHEKDHEVVVRGPVYVGPQTEMQGENQELMLRQPGDTGSDACDDIDGGGDVLNDIGDDYSNGGRSFNFDRGSGSDEESSLPLFLRAAMVNYHPYN
jgi:hypothetical protein